MADESFANAPEAPRSFGQKIASAFGWRKLPGHAIWVVGGGWKLLDVGGRLDMLSRVTEAMGGKPAMLASFVLSPWTSLGLIATGISYVVLIGEPKKRVQRHIFWPYLGWAIFATSLLSMITVVSYGAVEFYIRQEIAKGIAGVPRATPSNPAFDQGKPLYGAPRQLTNNQARIIISEAARMRFDFGNLLISYLDTDNETYAYATQFRSAFSRAAVKNVQFTAQGLGDPSWSGLMIEVQDIHNIPDQARKLQSLLLMIDVYCKIVQNTGFAPDYKLVLFVGPQDILR